MSVEPHPCLEQHFGSLEACLVDGDPEQHARERRIRRRALAISITFESAAIVVLVLVPLFGKTERITTTYMPIPPYYHHRGPTHPNSAPQPLWSHVSFFPNNPSPTPIPAQTFLGPTGEPEEPHGFIADAGPDGPCPGCIPIDDGTRQPERPREVRPQPPQRIVVTHIKPAMLIHRVEPLYPRLAVETHREGRVELRAIIATDGTIQSLEVAAGDPFFYQSALDAVRQWRYRPTILNDQPVEIDTYITVIYSMQH